MQLQVPLPEYLYYDPTFLQRWAGLDGDALKHLPTMTEVQQTMITTSGILWTYLNSTEGYLLAFVVALCACYWLFNRSSNGTMQGKRMGKHHRRQQELQQILNDCFTEAVENARARDLINKGEKKAMYKKFAKAWDQSHDLREQGVHQKKAASKARAVVNRSINPVIPGEPPPIVERKQATGKPVHKRSMLRGMQQTATAAA